MRVLGHNMMNKNHLVPSSTIRYSRKGLFHTLVFQTCYFFSICHNVIGCIIVMAHSSSHILRVWSCPRLSELCNTLPMDVSHCLGQKI